MSAEIFSICYTKVARIAEGSAEGLHDLYREAMSGPTTARAALHTLAPGRFIQDISAGARTEQIASLPTNMLRTLGSLVDGPPIPLQQQGIIPVVIVK